MYSTVCLLFLKASLPLSQVWVAIKTSLYFLCLHATKTSTSSIGKQTRARSTILKAKTRTPFSISFKLSFSYKNFITCDEELKS